MALRGVLIVRRKKHCLAILKNFCHTLNVRLLMVKVRLRFALMQKLKDTQPGYLQMVQDKVASRHWKR